jgi:hypothetical protein
MLQVIKAIYTDRVFQVRDAGTLSSVRGQTFGICQGCPLSPFLFVMVMTVLMHDAKRDLRTHLRYMEPPSDRVDELLYADDTLLISADPLVLDFYMTCVGKAGRNYGLSFNWSKLEVMPVRCAHQFYSPTGEKIKQKDHMRYLGSLLSNDGRIGTELNARLGAARSDFETLCKVWSHTSISKDRKLQLFNACVVNKL